MNGMREGRWTTQNGNCSALTFVIGIARRISICFIAVCLPQLLITPPSSFTTLRGGWCQATASHSLRDCISSHVLCKIRGTTRIHFAECNEVQQLTVPLQPPGPSPVDNRTWHQIPTIVHSAWRRAVPLAMGGASRTLGRNPCLAIETVAGRIGQAIAASTESGRSGEGDEVKCLTIYYGRSVGWLRRLRSVHGSHASLFVGKRVPDGRFRVPRQAANFSP